LPVVSYGCETWYFTLREEQRILALFSMTDAHVNCSPQSSFFCCPRICWSKYVTNITIF